MLHRAPRDDSGASAVEYGLLVFAVAAVLAAVLFSVGNLAAELFGDSCTSVAAEATPGRDC